MSVYREAKERLRYFTGGINYVGFENDSEAMEILKEPVVLYGQTLNPGDKITGFWSGTKRTSFELSAGYMTYVGRHGIDILFNVFDPEEVPQQADMFRQKPKWFLTFAFVGEDMGLLSFSAKGAAWDIQPKTIKRYE